MNKNSHSTFEKPTEFHWVQKQGKTNDLGRPKLCHFLGMERLVPKRRVFTVSKKFLSRGWTVSVCENGSTSASGGCLVRLPCPCWVKITTASCCLEQVWHIPPQELSWCPSGSVLMKTELCTVEPQWKESEHRVLPGPWAPLSGEFHFPPPKLCLKEASGTARYVFVVGEGGVLRPRHPTWNRGTSLAWLQLLLSRPRISLGLSLNKLI